MAINTISIFVSVFIIILFSAVLAISSYSAGLVEQKKDSPEYKASAAFIGISTSIIVITSLIILYDAIISKD